MDKFTDVIGWRSTWIVRAEQHDGLSRCCYYSSLLFISSIFFALINKGGSC